MESIAHLKRCPKCGVEKSLDCFYRDKHRKDGHNPYCKPCARSAQVASIAKYSEESQRACAALSPLKRCGKCGIELTHDHFWRDKSKKDGMTRLCKQCTLDAATASRHRCADRVKSTRRAYREKNREKLNRQACEQRGRRASAINARKRELYHANLDEERERQRRYYREHASEKRARRRAYAAANKEREAAKAAQWRKENRDKVNIIKNRRRAVELGAEGRYTAKEWRELCARFGNKCLKCGRDDVPMTPDHVLPLSRGGSNSIDNIQPLCFRCNSQKHAKYVDYRSGTPVYQPPLL